VTPKHDGETSTILDVLERRLELAEAMVDLTNVERDAIRSDDWRRLQTILDEKDKRIREFQETENDLNRWTGPSVGIEPSPSQRRILNKIKSTLLAVQTVERECLELLRERRKETAKTLQGMKTTKEGIKRFGSRRTGSPRFVDLRK
jgi:hypothetical protein